MVVFPSSLTEEEEALQKKYAKLKKKVRRPNIRSLLNPHNLGFMMHDVLILSTWSFIVFSEKGTSCLKEAKFN